ncbi:hypothetical protein TSAR_011436 [Trichomalopsis sarcophagae]|uniref:Colicin E3-like ribonuclease domain-containing protein n=1 Tax=Trichomalopsis sarcophagae TaxID=543379 RepID=A0A232FD53_9HYME|nr:hypothetical protein TSAR_011436 [Trichomalopsis sarcophagae]
MKIFEASAVIALSDETDLHAQQQQQQQLIGLRYLPIVEYVNICDKTVESLVLIVPIIASTDAVVIRSRKRASYVSRSVAEVIIGHISSINRERLSYFKNAGVEGATLDDAKAVRKIRGFKIRGSGPRIFSKKPGNNNRKGQTPPGQSYHPPPQTKDIKGIPGLESQKRKTPVQGGGGLRSRWQDSKGKNVYEWDSRHGELEKYRKSDGKHMGSFDPKTGNQNKGPDPKKNMDKKNM